MDETYSIQCKGVKKYFKYGDSIFFAIKGVDLDIKTHALVSIMGPSGCGKTTLLNLIAGLDKPSEGNILLDGHNINLLAEKQRIDLCYNKIGFIFQNFNLLPALTVFENVELPLLIAGKDDYYRRSQVKVFLEMMNLLDKKNQKPYELSGGERQRVAIARALVKEPSILLADEPTGNLDLETGEKIIHLLKEINKNTSITILIVTHDQHIAEQTDKIIKMSDGKILP